MKEEELMATELMAIVLEEEEEEELMATDTTGTEIHEKHRKYA